MLYELLSGLAPFDSSSLPRGPILEALCLIRDVEPARPSTRFRASPHGPDIAAARNIEASRLLKWLQGDIGWIVMKSLEKDRERRYDTANNFAADIKRILADDR